MEYQYYEFHFLFAITALKCADLYGSRPGIYSMQFPFTEKPCGSIGGEFKAAPSHARARHQNSQRGLDFAERGERLNANVE